MNKSKKLILVGDSAFAEIAFEYFQYDSDYEIVAFAVEREYLRRKMLFDRPIVALEDVDALYAPEDHSAFIAVTYGKLNRVRTRLLEQMRASGYAIASYVSSAAFVWRNVTVGENCFIFEDNTVQPFVTLADNVVLWSGNHIGHHSVIQANCFISSHVVVSGFCEVGAYSFLGVNATLSNNVKLGKDNWIGPGAIVVKDTVDGALIKAEWSTQSRISAPNFFRIKAQM